MPLNLETNDIHSRLAIVETQAGRIPIIEGKVDKLHDDMTALRAELGYERRAQEREFSERTNPQFRFEGASEQQRSFLARIDAMEVVKLGLILGAILGGMWYARPSHDELRQALAEVRK